MSERQPSSWTEDSSLVFGPNENGFIVCVSGMELSPDILKDIQGVEVIRLPNKAAQTETVYRYQIIVQGSGGRSGLISNAITYYVEGNTVRYLAMINLAKNTE